MMADPRSARFCCLNLCGGISMCDGNGKWLCVKCSSTAIPSNTAEREILAMVEKCRDARTVTPDIVGFTKQAITRSHELLPSTHYLVTELYDRLSTWYASEAALVYFSSAMREQSAIKGIAAGMRGHKYQECAVNSCLRGAHCTENHPPCIENANILWQGMTILDLSRKEQELLPASTLTTLLKYIPLLRIVHGEKDPDCAKIERIVSTLLSVVAKKQNKCDGCGKEECADLTLKRCSACHSARYCSSACQLASWAGHKKACKQIRSQI
jgi:hypothetical protein